MDAAAHRGEADDAHGDAPVDRRVLLADEANVRRIKALAATTPLDELERLKAAWDGDFWTDYDLRTTALALIEFIALSVDVASGVSYEEAATFAAAQALRQQPRRTEAEHVAVGAKVLQRLVAAGTSPNRYMDMSSPSRPTWREFTVRLVYEQASGASSHLRVTEEAINVLVDALDLDITDVQEAQEAQMRRYIDRGMMGSAERIAADARLTSVRLLEQVQRVVNDTMADIDAHDWSGVVDAQLEVAMAHVTERQRVERGLLAMVEERRDAIIDGEGRRSATALLDALLGCVQRHAALHAFILGARGRFRAAQDVAYRWRGVSDVRYDLDTDVIRLLAAAPVSAAGHYADRVTGKLIGRLAAPEAFAYEHFAVVFDSLFLPPNGDDVVEDEAPEFAGPPPPPWWGPVWDAANEVIDDITGPTSLADLLVRAGTAAPGHGVAASMARAALAHLAYSLVDPSTDDLVAVPLDRRYDGPEVSGPDLLVVRVARGVA